jgi:hypothetical protein
MIARNNRCKSRLDGCRGSERTTPPNPSARTSRPRSALCFLARPEGAPICSFELFVCARTTSSHPKLHTNIHKDTYTHTQRHTHTHQHKRILATKTPPLPTFPQEPGITDLLMAPAKLADAIAGCSGTRNLSDNLSDLKAQASGCCSGGAAGAGLNPEPRICTRRGRQEAGERLEGGSAWVWMAGRDGGASECFQDPGGGGCGAAVLASVRSWRVTTRLASWKSVVIVTSHPFVILL